MFVEDYVPVFSHEAVHRTNGSELTAKIDAWLDAERDRLPLLTPVAIGCGITWWQLYGESAAPVLFAVLIGIVLIGISMQRGSTIGRLAIYAALLTALGYGAITLKSHTAGAQPLSRPWIGILNGEVRSIEHITARGIVRYRLYTGTQQAVPPNVRINVDSKDALPAIVPGTVVQLKARLMPPPGPALPGSYDFARTAWFQGIGATGRAIGPLKILTPAGTTSDFWGQSRNTLAAHIEAAMDAETGPVGSALLVGTRGGITEADAAALRNSGMAHLLSVSGLHVTAIVGATYIMLAGLLALWPRLALRVPVPLIAAAGSAMVAVGYTLLTGMEVPTIRACVAALLILVAMALGREALSLRLLAAGATFVLVFWPEALAGPSFQLSFAAVGTIIVLHESPWMRRWGSRREEAIVIRLFRNTATILITGIAIELILAPIALFHFHKSGLYGALANVVAIPMTTFVIMPAQLAGLIADQFYLNAGQPFWWIATKGINVILWIAHSVSSTPGAVAMLPEISTGAFATIISCGLIIAIFDDRRRWIASVPMALAVVAMIISPRPDMLLTGDGQHLAILNDDGKLAILRPRAGEYARSILTETAAVDEEAVPLDELPEAQCNSDSCALTLNRGGRNWRILALRSNYIIPAMELAAACARSDIVISSRRLPWSCKPDWIKADGGFLERTGGLAFYLKSRRVTTVAGDNAQHQWSAYAPATLAQREQERIKRRANKNRSTTGPSTNPSVSDSVATAPPGGPALQPR